MSAPKKKTGIAVELRKRAGKLLLKRAQYLHGHFKYGELTFCRCKTHGFMTNLAKVKVGLRNTSNAVAQAKKKQMVYRVKV